MTEEELISKYPRLWHMAHDGAWPALQLSGLRSTKALLNDYGVWGGRREQLLRSRRPESVPLSAPGLLGAVLRDQKPMDDPRLAACLRDNLTPSHWYEYLNSKSFFWLSRSRIWKLLGARAYRGVAQTVLTVDTASLVGAHRGTILLSPINSGATLFNPQPRGRDTFKKVADFPFAERAKTRSIENNVVELLVDYAIPDLTNHVLAVHRVRNDQVISEIWRRPGAPDAERP